MKKLLLIFVCFSCTDMLDEIHFEIPPQLKTAVNKFYDEAEKHGSGFDKNNLTIQLTDLKSEGDLGNYYYIAGSDNTLTIIQLDRGTIELYLKYSNAEGAEFKIEALLFHELGHGLLYRNHTSDFSLMNPNKYFALYALDSTVRRDLIDELFSSQN